MIEYAKLLSMHGYGVYIWSSYALTAGVFVVNILLSTRRYRQARERLRNE